MIKPKIICNNLPPNYPMPSIEIGKQMDKVGFCIKQDEEDFGRKKICRKLK